MTPNPGHDHAATRDRRRSDAEPRCATCAAPIVLIATGPHYVHQSELAGHQAALEAEREERYRATLDRMARRRSEAGDGDGPARFEVCHTCGMIHGDGLVVSAGASYSQRNLPAWIVAHLAADPKGRSND